MDIQKLTPAIGAQISDIDLNQIQDADTLSKLQAELSEHQVLFFRGQYIGPEAQRALAATLGQLHIHPI